MDNEQYTLLFRQTTTDLGSTVNVLYMHMFNIYRMYTLSTVWVFRYFAKCQNNFWNYIKCQKSLSAYMPWYYV